MTGAKPWPLAATRMAHGMKNANLTVLVRGQGLNRKFITSPSLTM